jgi:DNA-binding transcriptional ArsR family regulator
MSEEQLTYLTGRLEQVETHLIRVERLLAIGFAEQVQERREAAEIGDETSAEILRRAPGWTGAGELKRAVVKSTGQSEPTVKRRLNKLTELGALERRGQGPSTEYRNTGLYG